ncbi:MAG: hypothetical protein ACM3XO_23915 [Bacteroidota bacterium]
MEPVDLHRWLLDSITQRFHANADLSLGDYIFSNSLFHTIAREQVEFMFAHRSGIIPHLGSDRAVAELVEHCIVSTKRYTYERNQFVNFTAEYDGLLDAEYTDFIRRIRAALQKGRSEAELEDLLVDVLQIHHERLRLIMASYCVTYQDQDLHANPLLQTVPCEEYSERFQLSILGIGLDNLIEPVLDIGCGSNGALVKYLRNQGIESYGVDRLAPREPFFFRSDWFDFDYEERPWGSFLAHQSLSTHFIYAYLHQPAGIERFTSLTIRILSRMQKGSFLCYAPGMPFFEPYIGKLPAFSLMRRRISMHLPEIEQIAYSTKISRVK